MRRVKRSINPPESEVLKACLELLRYHPKVALYWRANAGGMKNPAGRFVKFGFRGQPDIMAVLKPNGTFLAVECKRKGEKPSEAQQLFLAGVICAGGYAICVDDVDLLARYLNQVVRD